MGKKNKKFVVKGKKKTMIFKNYKKLYKKILENNTKLYYDKRKLKEEIAKLTIELEDKKGFLEQEKACSNALRKERAELKNKLEEYKPYFQGIEMIKEIDNLKSEDIQKIIDNSKTITTEDGYTIADVVEPKRKGRKPKNAK